MSSMGFATFICVAWLAQLVMTWLQLQQHKQIMKKLIKIYHSEPELYLTSGRFTKFLRPAADVFLIVDAEDVVKDCRIKQGCTVFARYHNRKNWIGMTIQQVIASLDEDDKSNKRHSEVSLRKAMRQACEQALSLEKHAKRNRGKESLAGV